MNLADLFPIILQVCLLPPGPSILSLILALLCQRPQIRMIFLIFGLASLYIASIPITSEWLRSQLEIYPVVVLENITAKAIVVLGAGRHKNAIEYQGDTIAGLGLERLRYAAKLQKMTGLPVMASGGSVDNEPVSEAEIMRGILDEFGVAASWLEEKSINTYENALFSSRRLKELGIDEILLVTHAWHMPRALEAFEKAGMKVVPAPTGFLSPNLEKDFLDWMPSAGALQMTYYALHEIIGRLWYQYHYYAKTN